MAAYSTYLRNRLIDFLWRGQPYAPPPMYYLALNVVAATAGSPGTEVSGGGYARVPFAPSLASMAGTQGAGSIQPSSGTSGQTSNNTQLVFPAPTANWGSILGFVVWDAPTGGNMHTFGSLASPIVVNAGDDAPFLDVSQLTLGVDS